ncbi:putative phage abortive infection protein [Microvirga antarctica]|uniref:putative phage abortive infection protein n=1 Tax=Microvirga antarctica TaxID=2819233 RepID=UPI001B30D263|nr:putative phage abortive infection protein [Microvirga antarctica]
MSVCTFWPCDGLASDNLSKLGSLGDYFGGLWGTLISVLALVVVFFTWRLTRQANNRNALISILTEMLKTHDSISSIEKGISSRFLREFSAVYKLSRRIVPDDQFWSVEDRVDIAYTFVFYGLSTHVRHSLSRHGDERLKLLQDATAQLRHRAGSKYKNYFSGYQEHLSHYLRNLFGMYVLINESNLKLKEKLNLSKVVRTKLSNYDQAVLALNVMSHLGREWDRQGLIINYKPIANVPERFFGYDNALSLKKYFPYVEFEWERSRGNRPYYYTISVMKFSLTICKR